jgi:hypothetical protein
MPVLLNECRKCHFDRASRTPCENGPCQAGSLLGVFALKPALYDDVCHLDHMWTSAVARGNSQSAEGPAVHVPLWL